MIYKGKQNSSFHFANIYNPDRHFVRDIYDACIIGQSKRFNILQIAHDILKDISYINTKY